MTKVRLKLHFYEEKIAHFSFIYEKVNKTDSLQPSVSNGTACLITIVVEVKASTTGMLPVKYFHTNKASSYVSRISLR